MTIIWHFLSPQKILDILKTNEKGLGEEEVKQRQKKYGLNKLPEKKPLSHLQILLSQLRSPLIYILLIAAAISFLLKENTDALIILAAVLINTLIGFFQENKAEQSLHRLKQMVEHHTRVIRDSKEHFINSQELVPGDIIILEAGDIIPADARIIESQNLQVSEALLTGESLPSFKKQEIFKEDTSLADRENMVYFGTLISAGKAKAVVVAIGLKTEIGKIASLLRETKEIQTPLQKKIAHLAKILTIIIALACIFLLTVGFLRGRDLLETLLISVAVAVAGIPEGLAIAVTVCLALGMQGIFKKQALVRKLIAAETLGSTSVICADKTGTLTEGKMTVAHIIPQPKIAKEEISIASLICNNAIIANPEDELKKWIIHGDSTETALLQGAVEAGIERKEVLKNFPRLDEIPFSSERMWMATLNKNKDIGSTNKILRGIIPLYRIDKRTVFLKGAPEKIFPLCQLTNKEIKKIKQEVELLTAKGLRLLAFCKKEVNKEIFRLDTDQIKNLKFLGLVALKDPLREEAAETIAQCKEAGLRPIIITGDHKLTAQAIAEEIGLLSDKEKIIEAKELEGLSDQELQELVKKIEVYARVEPSHKIRIIQALKANKEVVAMTGDGVNDAPAIKAADIGIALNSGSEVTKETADIVLLNNNFKTIVDAIKEGRIIFNNIKKVVLYLLSDSFTELILIGGAIIFGWPLPLLAAQILWVNIIEDTLPAMSLAYERTGSKDVLKEKPYSHETPIIDKEMKFIIFTISAFTGFLLLGLFWYLLNYSHFAIDHIRSFLFIGLGIDSLLYLFSCKDLKNNIWHYNIFNNAFLNWSVLFGIGMFFIALYIPFFQNILRVAPLGIADWFFLICFGLITVLLIETAKMIFYHKKT